jgi:hypothetical protein
MGVYIRNKFENCGNMGTISLGTKMQTSWECCFKGTPMGTPLGTHGEHY